MYKLNTTNQFEKDLKRCIKRGFPIEELRKVMGMSYQTGLAVIMDHQ